MKLYPIDKSKPVKIDLGSGINYYKGINDNEIDEWIHVDGDKAPHVEIVCDFAKGIPVETGIADEIHSSEVLEHIPPFLHDKIMKEFNRIMKIGCKCLFTVPNFEYTVREYYHGRMTYEIAQRNLFGDRENSYYHCHFQCFNKESATKFLEKYGFGNIDFSKSPGLPDIEWWLVIHCEKVKNV